MRKTAKLIGVAFLLGVPTVLAQSGTGEETYQRQCEVIDGVVVCRSLAEQSAQLSPEERGAKVFAETDLRHGPLMGYGSPGYGDSQAKFIAVVNEPGKAQSVRELRLKYLENAPEGNKRLIIFDKPKDLKRHALLTVSHKNAPDEQWTFDPQTNQVKRVLSNNSFTPFSGTDISYEDISTQDTQKYEYQYLRDDELNGTKCYLVRRFPKDPYSGYQYMDAWIDQASYLVRKIDYYDRQEKLLKTLSLNDYSQFNDRYWRPGEMVMLNHRTGRSTQLLWSEYRFNTGLTESDFSLSSLKNAN